MTKLPYSDKFIYENADFIKNESVSGIESKLKDRTNNLEDEKFSMDYMDIIKITAIDHYMCKLIVNGNYDSRISVYFNELFNQLRKQPLLFLSLPIKDVPIDILRKYIPRIGDIKYVCDLKKKHALIISDKIEKGIPISKDEQSLLITYLNYSCSYNNLSDEIRMQDIMIKYLMRSNFLGLQSSSFMIKCLGYRKCREEGLDDIQIFVGDISYKDAEPLGISLKKTVTVSKKHLVGTKFKDNKLSSKFNKTDKDKHEGLVFLMILYHELRHAVQDNEYFNRMKSDLSFSKGVHRLLSLSENGEYLRNYRYYDIEADANMYGWKWLRSFINQYMNLTEKERLDMYAELYAAEYMIRKDLVAKVGSDNILKNSWNFTMEHIDLIFKNNPNLLKGEFSNFRVFYHENGMPKNSTEIIMMDSRETLQFPEMFFNVMSDRASKIKLDRGYINKLSLESQKNIIRNCNMMISHVYEKLSDFKMEKLDGTYVVDGDSFNNNDKAVFKYVVKGYFKMALCYSQVVSVIVKDNPQLLGYAGGVKHINDYLTLINNNKLVQDYLNGAQIDHIPESLNDLTMSVSGRSKK